MFSNGRSLILLMPEQGKKITSSFFQSLSKSRYVSTSFTHMTQFRFLLKSSPSEWRKRGVEGSRSRFLEQPHSSRSAEPRPPVRCCPSYRFIFSLHQSAPDLPPKQTHWLASLATRGPSERLAHKCQSRFCFPALHYSADTVPHFVSTVKPLGATSLHPPVRSQTAQCTTVIDTSIFRCPSFRN